MKLPKTREPVIRLAIVTTHPIQYYAPWFAHIAQHCDLTVFYAYNATPQDQAAAGFGKPFSWDIDLLSGYRYEFLQNIARRPSLQSFWGCNTPSIAHKLANGSYDAVILFGWNKLSLLQAWCGALLARIPVYVRTDSQLRRMSWAKRLLKWPLYAMLLPRLADYLSPGARADAYLRHFRVPLHKIHRIPHMVDVERFAFEAQAARTDGRSGALRSRMAADQNTTVLLQVGKLIEKKRPMVSIAALSRLKPKLLSGIQLWFVGEGPLSAKLDVMSNELKLPIRLMGFVNQRSLPEIYAAADILLLPSSEEETWGLVVNEAQACGLPAIVSDAAGCSTELIEEGVTGWIVPLDDTQRLAEVMEIAHKTLGTVDESEIRHKSESSSYSAGTLSLLSLLSWTTQAASSGKPKSPE